MTDHGWTAYQYGGYIMQTDKAQYYMELESDENGKVTSWYLNNWPEGISQRHTILWKNSK